MRPPASGKALTLARAAVLDTAAADAIGPKPAAGLS